MHGGCRKTILGKGESYGSSNGAGPNRMALDGLG